VWAGSDGLDTAPPVDVATNPALAPLPPLPPSAAAIPPPLPAPAAAHRADLLALVVPVAAHAVVSKSRAVGASRRFADRRAGPPAAAALHRADPSPPASTVAAAAHKNPAARQHCEAPPTLAAWRALRADGEEGSQCALSPTPFSIVPPLWPLPVTACSSVSLPSIS